MTAEPVHRYHTGPGFFINSYLIFAAINATVWVYLLLALTNSVTYPCGPDGKQTCSVLTSERSADAFAYAQAAHMTLSSMLAVIGGRKPCWARPVGHRR